METRSKPWQVTLGCCARSLKRGGTQDTPGLKGHFTSKGLRLHNVPQPRRQRTATARGLRDALPRDAGRADDVAWEAAQTPVEYLPESTLVYLLGSRYCETDQLSGLAWSLFGRGPTGWGRGQAICDCVLPLYEHTRALLHRLSGGYPHPCGAGPMDFAGWFEAYLGNRWYTFDARNNTPRIGRVLMARGRDACDVALVSSFGPNTLQQFTVWAEEVPLPNPLHHG